MNEQVTMTEQERQEFEQFKAEKAKKEALEKQRQDRDAYKTLVNETIDKMFPRLEAVSRALGKNKARAYDAFKKALELKYETYDVKSDQRSHTFTDEKGNRRITLGQYTTDSYDDTVNEGIAKVKEYIGSLAKDDDSRMLVSAVLKLLSRDQAGNLKASRVIQLRKMAEDSGNECFIDGVRIIEAAYRPTVSKYYVRAERKNALGAWENVPLGMTEA